MDFFFYFIVAIFHILPYLFLLLVPFKSIKYKASKLIGIAMVLSLIITLASTFMPPIVPGNSASFFIWRQFYSLSSAFLILVTCRLVFKIGLLPLCTVLLITHCYLVNYINFSWILRELMYNFVTYNSLSLLEIFIPNVIILAITLPLAVMFYQKLLAPVVKLNNEQSTLWHFLWVFPLIFYIICNAVIPLNTFKIALGVSPIYLFNLQLAWLISTFTTIGILLYIIIEAHEKGTLEEKIHTSQLSMYLQKKEYTRIQNLLDETRHARHDLRQHLLVLKTFAQTRDLQGISDYINDYLNNIDLESPTSLCENQPISALAQYYLELARKNGIEVTTELNVPPKIPFSDIDITIIFGNILENAIESCSRQKQGKKYINIKALFTNNNMLAIVVKNSFDHKIEKDEDKNYLSSKNAHNIGLGTTSIKTVTEKYKGVVKFKHENNVFEASVLLTSVPETKEEVAE